MAAAVDAFRLRLRELGWTEGVNIQFDVRWSNSDVGLMRAHAAEVVAGKPDVIFVQSNPSLAILLEVTRTIPIVFVHVADPVGGGFIQSLSRPGGNVTGVTNFEATMGGKWLELLKEIAPKLERVMVLRHPETAAHHAFYDAAETASRLFEVEALPGDVRDGGDIERAVNALARAGNGGLIALPHTVTERYRDLIIDLSARYHVPAIYAFRHHTEVGGLVSYGIDASELNRRAAPYVDRILKGAKPSELPVQAAMKFELVVNLTAAHKLGLDPPRSILARADELIE
jgi:putative ABC transport system substrate-binding protein